MANIVIKITIYVFMSFKNGMLNTNLNRDKKICFGVNFKPNSFLNIYSKKFKSLEPKAVKELYKLAKVNDGFTVREIMDGELLSITHKNHILSNVWLPLKNKTLTEIIQNLKNKTQLRKLLKKAEEDLLEHKRFQQDLNKLIDDFLKLL